MYVDDGNIFKLRLHAFKENTEAVLVASKKTGLYVKADKKWYMVMCGEQNAERSRNLEIDYISFEEWKRLIFFGKALKYQNTFQEHNKSRL